MLAEKIKLDADEKILTQVRKHWFILSIQLAAVGGVALLPLLAAYILYMSPLGETARFLEMSTPLVVAGISAWLIVFWMALFGVWTNYYLDVWTVTNKRLIMVDQRGLFHRETGSFRLERLQDINVSVNGILATFLKFGDLHAETASEDRSFIARSIPNPQELKALILTAADQTTFSGVRSQNPSTIAQSPLPHDGL